MTKTSIVGDLINFRGLVYGPSNEMGVVALFAKVSEEMGFIIEEVRVAFPDCVARKRVDKGWERVFIEFEYLSSNFQRHGHDPDACDLIVCWKHDWESCPRPHLAVVCFGRPSESVRSAGTRPNRRTAGDTNNDSYAWGNQEWVHQHQAARRLLAGRVRRRQCGTSKTPFDC